MVKIKNIGSNSIIRSFAGLLLSFAGGYVFSGASIAGLASFADISLAGSLSLPYAAAVFIGAVIRSTFSDTVGRSIVKLAAISLIVTAKLFSERCSRPAGSGIVTAVSVILSGAAISALIGELPKKLLFYGLYGAISGFAAYSGAALTADLRERRVVELRGFSGCAYGVVFMLYSASLCSMTGLWVNPGIVLGAGITLTAAYFYGSAGGLICGALAASGAFLASPEAGIPAAMLPAAGLFTGLLKRSRIFLSAVFFTLCCFMLSVLTGAAAEAELTLAIVCGAALFVVFAPCFSDKWISTGQESANDMGGMNSLRLNFLSDAIEAVRLDSGRISAVLSASSAPGSGHPVRGKVCSRCYRRSLCRGSETAGELVPILPEDCVRKQEFAAELENDLRSRAAEQVMKLRYSEERELLNEHMKMAGELIRSLSEQPEYRYSAAVSRRITDKLSAHGMEPNSVSAFYGPSNRLAVEIYFDAGEITGNSSRICDLISDELEMKLCAAATVSSVRETKISLYEKPSREIRVYSSSASAKEGEISGDSSVTFSDSMGRSYVVLSDGMGSGKSAAVDSHMVIGMFRRLICSGMELEPAVRLINSVMAAKSRNESFATLDVIVFDPDDCTVASVKSGAAATILRRGSDVIKITASTFPIGITKQAEISEVSYELSPGDMIVMFSDGISDNAGLFIKELLLRGSDIGAVISEIAEKADIFSPTGCRDDVTVIGILITES